MDIKISRTSAENISQSIIATGTKIINAQEASISGGNTTGVEQAGLLSGNASSVLAQYESIVKRDGTRVVELATSFEDFDQHMGNQMRQV